MKIFYKPGEVIVTFDKLPDFDVVISVEMFKVFHKKYLKDKKLNRNKSK